MAERLTRRKLEAMQEALGARLAGDFDEIASELSDSKKSHLIATYEAAQRWVNEELSRRGDRRKEQERK